MKHTLLALSLAVFCLLSGCAEPPPADPVPEEDVITVQDVEQIYHEAAAVYDWFDAVSPPCTGDPVEYDGNVYRLVDVEGLETYADLEARVRAYFSPFLADEILTDSRNFRDIDGKLYCAEGGRGSNIYFYDKAVRVFHPDETHFTVELTFWANFQEPAEDASAQLTTFGYSREVLNYELTDVGYRFTNFCSSDGLDTEADTVCTFNTADVFETGAYEDLEDWPLICYLCNADGAAAEEPFALLMLRFLERPEDILAQLAVLAESPFMEDPDFDRIRYVVTSPAAVAAAWLYPDELPDFTAALDRCQPEDPAQQELLRQLRTVFETRSANAGEHDADREFSFLLPSDTELMLTLGPQKGHFPWGFDLAGTPVEAGPADTFGTAYAVDCDGVSLQYGEKDGVETLYRMETTIPYADENRYCCTPRGMYCGYPEEQIQRLYLHAVTLENFADPDFDRCWVYEIGTRHIAFFVRDGIVEKIAVENLIDGQMLN